MEDKFSPWSYNFQTELTAHRWVMHFVTGYTGGNRSYGCAPAVHTVCVIILCFHSAKGLTLVMFPVSFHLHIVSALLYLSSVCLFFGTCLLTPKIAGLTFRRRLITNWDCHHLGKKAASLTEECWHQSVTHYVQVFTCQPETSAYQTGLYHHLFICSIVCFLYLIRGLLMFKWGRAVCCWVCQ